MGEERRGHLLGERRGVALERQGSPWRPLTGVGSQGSRHVTLSWEARFASRPDSGIMWGSMLERADESRRP